MEFLTLAPGSDRIPVELFQILKDDAVESAALNMQYVLNMQYASSRQWVLEFHSNIQPEDGPLDDGENAHINFQRILSKLKYKLKITQIPSRSLHYGEFPPTPVHCQFIIQRTQQGSQSRYYGYLPTEGMYPIFPVTAHQRRNTV